MRPKQVSAYASPPARGAWIETHGRNHLVAYRRRRPPRGGRGLKLRGLQDGGACAHVAPRAGGVD